MSKIMKLPSRFNILVVNWTSGSRRCFDDAVTYTSSGAVVGLAVPSFIVGHKLFCDYG